MAVRWVELGGEEVEEGGGEDGDPRGTGSRPETTEALRPIRAHFARLLLDQIASKAEVIMRKQGLRIAAQGVESEGRTSRLEGRLAPMSVDGAFMNIAIVASLDEDDRVTNVTVTTHWSNTIADAAVAARVHEAAATLAGTQGDWAPINPAPARI